MRSSIDHLPGDKQAKLLAMAAKIREMAPDAGMIVLFGSHARGDWVDDQETGYHSDYDVLVVVDTLELPWGERRRPVGARTRPTGRLVGAPVFCCERRRRILLRPPRARGPWRDPRGHRRPFRRRGPPHPGAEAPPRQRLLSQPADRARAAAHPERPLRPEDVTSLAMARELSPTRPDIPSMVPLDRLSSGQYVLVSHRERSIEVWTREAAGGWTQTIAREGDVADLASIGARLDVSELYEVAAEPAE